MTIDLPEDLARALNEEVAAGRAKSVSAIVTAAVRAHLATVEDLRRSLDEAEAEYRRYGGIPWEEIEAEIEANLKSGA